MEKLTLEIFIKKANKIHGNKYNYSKVEYINSYTKVCIICPKHGEFWQTPNSHLSGRGCLKCKRENDKHTQNWFIKESKKIHGNKYDYSKVEYKGREYKVSIICPEHGEFIQLANHHLQGHGCPICGRLKRDNSCKKTLNDIQIKCDEIFDKKYKIIDTEYKGIYSKLNVLCPEHGIFKITSNALLSGHGCPICGRNKLKLSLSEFINRSNNIHENKYDYSKVILERTDKKVCIICPKHGEFWQLPSVHLSGCGCPHCKSSSLENEVRCFLNNENINYIAQKRAKWLGKQSLDFFLPDYNIAIECQGEQHFIPCKYFGGKNKFKHILELDQLKRNLCKENNVKLIYYTHFNYNYDFELITNLEDLKNKIYNN